MCSEKNLKVLALLFYIQVGAGLPVIASMNRIISSGDPVHSIVGSLSGNHTYRCNSFYCDSVVDVFHCFYPNLGMYSLFVNICIFIHL